MPIKNKDGSIFSFNKPNPVMLQQDFWSKTESVIIHNKFGQRHIVESNEKFREVKLNEKAKVREIEKQDDIKIIQSFVEEKPKHISESVIEVWCLPCLGYNENEDELYGESYSTLKYGDKFIFRARLLEVEDLHIQLVTDQKINEYSVVYPKTNGKRWWKVQETKESKGFYFMNCIISDYQPSFG